MNKPVFQSSLLALLLSVAVVLPVQAAPQLTLMHVHGLSYSTDGKQLMIPSHHGLAIYRGGRWSKAPGPEHDYMGFSSAARAIYSSGHPAPGSKQANPFGLIKSVDGGRSWQKLGLEGESDFHMLATSYRTNAVYVVNANPNSRMSSTGLHYSLNDGASWQHVRAAGLSNGVTGLAVHPANAKMVAVSTGDGLYLSTDYGEHLQPVAQGLQVLSAYFSLDGNSLWFGSYRNAPALSRLDLKTRKVAPLKLPLSGQDAVVYLAQNPAKPKEWAFATYKRNVYLSADEGNSWKVIAKAGQTQE
jgi:hypothetical protein